MNVKVKGHFMNTTLTSVDYTVEETKFMNVSKHLNQSDAILTVTKCCISTKEKSLKFVSSSVVWFFVSYFPSDI